MTTSPIEDHTVQLGAVRMHFRRAGSGDPVVLLHGWPQTSAAWDAILPELARHHTVIAPDLRGMGSSSKPAAGYDTDTVAQDIHELVAALGFENVHLVGHDWGAATAYAYAAQYRDEVLSLAIFEMVLPGFGIMEEAMVPQPGGNFLWHMGFQSVPDVAEALIRGREGVYLQNIFRQYAYDPHAVRGERTAHYVAAMEQIGALPAGLRYYQDYFVSAEQNRRHSKSPLTMPVLAMGGEACLGPLPKQCLELAAEHVTGGIIERCGHWIGEERPAFVVEQILGHIARADGLNVGATPSAVIGA